MSPDRLNIVLVLLSVMACLTNAYVGGMMQHTVNASRSSIAYTEMYRDVCNSTNTAGSPVMLAQDMYSCVKVLQHMATTMFAQTHVIWASVLQQASLYCLHKESRYV